LQGKTLLSHDDLRFSLFQRKGGRAPELDNLDNLYTLGQYMGQMHCVAKAKAFQRREALTVDNFGYQAVATVAATLLPDDLRDAYLSITSDILTMVEQRFAAVDDLQQLRCHGDCHVGNILWRDDKPHFVDFDDARMAPAIQDLWMFLSGDTMNQQRQMLEIIEGYENFMPLNTAELNLIEPLRALRMIHYCAWLAKRWSDPAFPMHFPWFNTQRYWGEHILELKEQCSVLQEPALTLPSWL
jgi:Ser/Thr protein kinase RdoA (MazF antagonist)